MFRNKIKGDRRLGSLHTPTPSVLRYIQACTLLLHYHRNQTEMLPHEPVHQQLYYLWPLHTYINRISVILTLCYFFLFFL